LPLTDDVLERQLTEQLGDMVTADTPDMNDSMRSLITTLMERSIKQLVKSER
jgi:hypothetical protein